MGRRLGILVAALLVTAGCNAFPSDTSQSSGPTATLTPVPVPVSTNVGSETPAAPPASVFPPGVSPSGSVDPERLARAHDAVLANRSYTWVYSQRQIDQSTGNVSNTLLRRVEVGTDATLVVDRQSLVGTDEIRRVSRYLTAGNGYLREQLGEAMTRRSLNSTRGERRYAPIEEFLESFLVDRPVDVSLVERDGQRFVRLYAPPGTSPAGLFNLQDGVNEYTVTAYVTPAGFVQTVVVSYETGALSAESQRVTIRAEYSDVGATTVTRPDWVDRTETTTPTGTVTPTGTATNTTGSPATDRPSARATGAVSR